MPGMEIMLTMLGPRAHSRCDIPTATARVRDCQPHLQLRTLTGHPVGKRWGPALSPHTLLTATDCVLICRGKKFMFKKPFIY